MRKGVVPDRAAFPWGRKQYPANDPCGVEQAVAHAGDEFGGQVAESFELFENGRLQFGLEVRVAVLSVLSPCALAKPLVNVAEEQSEPTVRAYGRKIVQLCEFGVASDRPKEPVTSQTHFRPRVKVMYEGPVLKAPGA